MSDRWWITAEVEEPDGRRTLTLTNQPFDEDDEEVAVARAPLGELLNSIWGTQERADERRRKIERYREEVRELNQRYQHVLRPDGGGS